MPSSKGNQSLRPLDRKWLPKLVVTDVRLLTANGDAQLSLVDTQALSQMLDRIHNDPIIGATTILVNSGDILNSTVALLPSHHEHYPQSKSHLRAPE